MCGVGAATKEPLQRLEIIQCEVLALTPYNLQWKTRATTKPFEPMSHNNINHNGVSIKSIIRTGIWILSNSFWTREYLVNGQDLSVSLIKK